MRRVDILIAGGGAAGLSLACQLVRGPLRESSILIVDYETKDQNDRTWCYWTARPTLFNPIVCRSWRHLRVVAPAFTRTLDLRGYRYDMIRGGDFYRFAHDLLAAHPTVQFTHGRVERIEDGAEEARAVVGDETFAANWVFDSRFAWSELEREAQTDAQRHLLKQEFAGWEIETIHDAFEPDHPTLMDFRTPQSAGLCFAHLLPLCRRRALVDIVVCATQTLGSAALAESLDRYLRDVLDVGPYRVLREEHGVTPMTDRPFPRRASQHVMAIGLHGGRAKPSTGYAFMRIQHDAAAIAASLAEHGHPFHVPHDARRYRYFDAVLLGLLAHHPQDAVSVFTTLFERNSADRIFRLLDGEASLWENLHMVPSLPSPLLERAIRDVGMLAHI